MADKPERQQDLGGPQDEALEQHIRQMLDINEPDVSDESETAPQDNTKTGSDELNSTIESINEQLLQDQPATAPLVAAKTPKKTASKKVVITHISDETNDPPAENIPQEPIADHDKELAEQQPKQQPEADDTALTEPPARPVVDTEFDDSPLDAEIQSAATNEAVAAIVAAEGDQLLAMNDANIEHTDHPVIQRKPRSRLRRVIASSSARWVICAVLFIVLGIIGTIPTSRYYILNTVGVRSAVSLKIVDQSSNQPLRHVQVSLAGKQAQTDASGHVQFTGMRLGTTELLIQKRAFADYRRTVTVGWGSNPLGNVHLQPTGSQLQFKVVDYVSGKGVSAVEATLGEATAVANDAGEIILTIDGVEGQKAMVTFKKAGYADMQVEADLNTSTVREITLTSDQKVAFVSKRAGTYDLYTVGLDGKNEKLALAGTGKERDDIVLAQHPYEQVAIMIATRDGKYSANGELLRNLQFINLQDNSTKSIVSSTQLRLVDWLGSRIVYTQVVDEAPFNDPSRTRLMSYDYVSGDNRQLATATYFNDIVAVDGSVYYAPASANQQGVNNGFFVVKPDGTGKRSIFDKEVWNVFRTNHHELVLAVQQDWYKYELGTQAPQKLDGQPTSTASRQYTDSPDGAYSLRIDMRDGKPNLLALATATNSESSRVELIGLKQPVRWISNTMFVVRVVSDDESADYVMSIDGGNPKKITNVTDARGIDRWLY